MKAAREEADAKQKQMERQMKEETERLKTQFIFKVSRLFFFFPLVYEPFAKQHLFPIAT